MTNKRNEKLWSVSGEAGVLGSMIVSQECIAEVISILPDESCFFKVEHRQIYSALVRMYVAGTPVDAVSLRDELKKAGHLEGTNGVKYLARVMNSVPHAANALHYAKIVRDRQRYRQLLNNVEKMRGVVNEPLDLDEMIQKFRELSLEIEPAEAGGEWFDVKDHATEVAVRMRDHQETIETPFWNVNRIIGGVAPGELVIIAGRPSMGKTALALDFTLSWARADKAVTYFTLEMTHRALIERACCNLAGVDMTKIKGGNPSQEDLEKLYAAALELKELPIIVHEGGTTPEKQIAFVRAKKKARGVDVVVIDYLQLMSVGKRVESRQQEITAISSKLKRLAMQEHIPVIALSQLNRAVEAREGHRPRLSDLRESGSLEQDADVVMLLHREDYYRRSEEPSSYEKDGLAELIVAKNKRGPAGIAKLIFLEEYAKFGDLRKDCQEEAKDDEGLFEEGVNG